MSLLPFSSLRLQHLGFIFFAVLLLPLAALLPYLFFDSKMQVLQWAWKENYLPFWLPLIVSFLGAIFSFVLLSKFLNLGFYLYTFIAITITASSTILSMLEQRHFSLFVIFLFTCLLVFTRERLRKILNKEFYDPKMNFWEELPKPIPKITVKMFFKGEEKNIPDAFLSNLGKNGCFLFRKKGIWEPAPSSIRIQFNASNEVHLKVKPTLYLRNRRGVGLHFTDITSKENNFYSQLDKLRRIGYAQN